MINGLLRELTTKVRKSASMLILRLRRSLRGLLEPCRWNVSGFGRWTRREDILVLEARAWMKCVDRSWKGIYGTKCRQLVHGDNMALVLTQCRWRSRLFALIVILRRAAAYILARDMVIVSRWIMSEMNTSDAPSRLQEQHQPQDQVMHATDEQ